MTMKDSNGIPLSGDSILRPALAKEINRGVIRQKFQKRRHLVLTEAIHPQYLDSLFPIIRQQFQPQTVTYNGGIAKVPKWKISCYIEVLDGGIPTTEPNLPMLKTLTPFLQACDSLFLHWYRQQHNVKISRCRRLMTFVTRYTPNPGEQALLKHIDGAGKVDGSIVVALPTSEMFEGGGLTFWDGRKDESNNNEIHYETRNGDVAFIDRAVWHQADPIKGIRWALVIFYKVLE